MHLRCVVDNEKLNYETISEIIKKHKEKINMKAIILGDAHTGRFHWANLV